MTVESKGETKAKVLIVDDTPENLDILMAALAGDYAVVAARDGEKALALARREPRPDAILLDIMMPGIDGYEVCRRLKEDDATRAIPVLFLTALTDEGSELKGLELGAVDYIHKPISIPLVQARVRAHVGLIQAQRRLAEQLRLVTEATRLREDVDHILRHDLKGPLGPVIGFAELLQGDPAFKEEQLDGLRQIHRAGLDMLEMINRSLDLYKMESGDYHYQPQLTEPRMVLQRVINDLAVDTARREVEFELEGTSAGCYSDPMLLYSLLCNLMKNAVEASPEGGRVAIELSDQGPWTTIRLRNQGAVPEKLRDGFFDKYTTAGKSGGTGLGTYSARLMAETMLGEIAMESDETTTTLTVRLPSKAVESELIDRLFGEAAKP